MNNVLYGWIQYMSVQSLSSSAPRCCCCCQVSVVVVVAAVVVCLLCIAFLAGILGNLEENTN